MIDDDFHIQRIVEDRLKAENFEVVKATDGIEGLRMVYDFHPDVVLLDIMMPTIDGHSVLLCIKKDDKIKNIPVIMMTAKRERADVVRAAAAGAADYIVKPIDFRQLIKKIYESAHAVPPEEKEPPGQANIRSMAQDLANLSFEIDAVAASAGLDPEKKSPPKSTTAFDMQIESAGSTAVLRLQGILKPEDTETLKSEIRRLDAAGIGRYVVDISALHSVDISEIMILKEILDLIALKKCERRLVDTDSRRRRFLRQCNLHLEHPVFSTTQEALQTS